MDGWLRSLGLEQYVQKFRDNGIHAEELRGADRLFTEPGAPAPIAQEQRARPQPPKGPQQQVRTQPFPAPVRESADRSAPVERMRPPPPPGFNEWSKQQQARAPEAPVRNIPAEASRPQAAPQQNHANQAPAGEQHRLPGEPAMKLRPHPPVTAQKEGTHKE
jgi:hypothetical protein